MNRNRRAGRQNTAEGRRYEQALRRMANSQARSRGYTNAGARARGRAAGGRGG